MAAQCMVPRRSTFACRLAGIVSAGLLALPFSAPDSARAQDAWPSEVQALYKIRFNGFEIGAFEFDSSVHGHTYAMNGTARISALLGVVNWQGITRVSGRLTGNTPKPAGFSFDFQGGSKAGSIRMGFQNASVSSLSLTPPPKAEGNVVPLRPEHLKGVLDPMSAVLALSRPKGGDPCHQRLAVFDGKLRFDLAFAFRREERVADAGGRPDTLRVCRVRYIPIAGHKRDEETEQIRRATGIEVAFRHVAGAELFIPYRITLPTIAGSATLVSQRVRITTPRHGQIALVY